MADLDYLKRNVFPGESGGDYDALFGYSNRQGPFAGVRPTQMTINEVLQFTDPRGPYAQWVEGQVGRVATPVGAYQVVGSTLRDAVKGLGLTGNEIFDQNTQDAIGMWIYQNQGPAAWEGWNKGGGQARLSTSGGPSMVGLLDMMQGQEPEKQPFMERLALAANTLRMNPDPNIATMLQQRQEQRAQTATANRTAQWLISQGREDLAQAMLSGAIDPKTAASVALQPAERQGRVVDAAALRQMFPNAEIAEGLYSMQPDGTISKVGGGAPSVNIDMGGGKFEESFAKGDADRLAAVEDVGLAAMRNISRIDQLESLLQNAPQGMEGGLKLAAGEFGINTEGLDNLQAAQALINSLVPEQRAPGTGPMSDADLALFKQSLPRIINQPGGNQTIISTMRAIAQYDAAGAQIVQELRDGQIDRAEAFRRLKSRSDPLAAVRNTFGGGSASSGASPQGGAGSSILTPEDYQYLELGAP